MKNKKIIYIIPGYGDSHKKQPAYNKIAKIFKDMGIKPVRVEIKWHYKKPRSFDEYIKQFLKRYKKPKGCDTFILGFSYGALISFLSEPKVEAEAMILCSLSPFFKEDMKNLEEEWVNNWRKNFLNSDYYFSTLVKNIKTKTYILVGDGEHKSCITRARSARRKIKNSRLILVKNGKHNVNQKEYLESIKRLACNL